MNDPLSFLDSAQSSSEDPLDFLNVPKRSKIEKGARLAAQYGIGAAQTALAPLDIALEVGSRKAPIPEKFKEFYAHKAKDIPNERLQKFEKQMESYTPPDLTISGLAEKFANKLGYDLKPEDNAEIAARFGGNIVSPKNLKNLGTYVKNLATKEGRVTSQWKSLEKSAKGNIEKTNLLDFAKQRNLTPEETSVVMKGPDFIDKISKVAKKSKKYKEITQSLNEKLGSEYENLKKIGRQGGPLNLNDKVNLESDLNKILIDMGETYFEGPDTKSAREAIEKAIQNIGSKEGTIADLINSRQGLSEGINWNNIAKGDFLKNKARDSFMSAIERKNPQVAKRLRQNDTDWVKFEKLQKKIKKPPASINIKGIEIPATNLAFFAAPFTHIVSGGTSAKLFLAKEAVQRLSSEMLFNPKLHDLHSRFVNALKSGDMSSQKKIFSLLQNIIKKDDPKLYDEIFKET